MSRTIIRGKRLYHRRTQLMAAQTIEPYSQGAFDGFCGLYAIINALRLALVVTRPLSDEECEALYRHGIEVLHRHDKLFAAARFGLRVTLWFKLARELTAAATKLTEKTVVAERPLFRKGSISRASLFSAIELCIMRQAPVLLLLRGAYSHYTVVSGCSATRLTLFDSYGYAWINLTSCEIATADSAGRHQIHAGSMIVFEIGDVASIETATPRRTLS